MMSNRKTIITVLISFFLSAPSYARDFEEGSSSVEINTAEVSTYTSAWDAGVSIPAGVTITQGDRSILEQITVQQYEELMAGQDPAAMTARDGRPLDEVIAEVYGGSGIDLPTQTMGLTNEQLVFTPISPCRIIDTGVAGGNFTAGETRSYTIGGVTDYSSIGGNGAGCGLPGAENVLFGSRERVRAWSINIVAAAPDGGGNLVAWPTNQTVPNASTINFQALSPNLNVANGVVVQNCTDTFSVFVPGDTLCGVGDLSFRANFSGARLVVDVAGYYTRADVETIKSQNTVSNSSTFVDTSAGGCINLATCTLPINFITSNTPAGNIVASGSAEFQTGGTDGTPNDWVGLHLSTTSGTNCTTANRSRFMVDNLSTFDTIPVHIERSFPVAADGTTQVWLNADTDDISGFGVSNYNLNCSFVPN